ncbi:outer membrane lipoprotein-sorting protein [Crossiella equi]|uniref:Outer membrane lipoprotein-sorting protein n=1 Tax=Crossiella equi TaxID=130796 RepID=A0ABS5AIM5_9PSEU|nr:sigma-E factor regulatory protein RseB domain-containing protein [Crossiella equi]MBP2476429.1 outer membrane lipoprotein-sorting protein [Crossiella equi]
MDRRKATVALATAGAVAGVAGLALLASPAGAGAAPSLPSVSAEDLVQSVLTTTPPALGGTVSVTNNLGLPAIPGLPQAGAGESKLRVWTDGAGRSRFSLPQGQDEKTIVRDGTTVWSWDSAERKVTKTTIDPKKLEEHKAEFDKKKVEPTDPASASRELVNLVRQQSDLSVDGTAEVAGRAAYELVLTPKPNERTLLRGVRVAVDAEKRIPLRVTVLSNGSTDPALQIGFSQLNVGAQDENLFKFTPPAGATVEEQKAEDKAKQHEGREKPSQQELDKAKAELEKAFKVVGEGWDTTVVGKLPQQALKPADGQQSERREGRRGGDGAAANPLAMVQQLGKAVNGAWGSGWVIETKVGTALVTSDGRFAVGAVPQQVLTEAIGQVK